MKKTKIDHYTDKEALDFHSHKKPGKIEISSSKNMTSKRDLALAYSPGVAAPVKEISKDSSKVYGSPEYSLKDILATGLYPGVKGPQGLSNKIGRNIFPVLRMTKNAPQLFDRLLSLFESDWAMEAYLDSMYHAGYYTEEEIEELGRGLQAYVKTHAKQKNILFQQATYTNPSYIGEDHSNNKLFMKIYKRYGRHMKTKDSRRTLKTYNDPDMIKYPRVKISELTPGNYWDISKELMKCLVELEEIPFTVVNNVTVLYQGDVATWALQFRNGIKQKSKIFSAHRRLSHKS